MLVNERDSMIRKNQKPPLPPAAALNEREDAGSLQCAKRSLLECLEHLLILRARPISSSRLSNTSLTNGFCARARRRSKRSRHRKTRRGIDFGNEEVVTPALFPVGSEG